MSRRRWFAALTAGAGLLAAGCSRESVRIALETQHRSDQIQQAVFERQHEALCLLLYRDLLRRLETADLALSDAVRTSLNRVWNERDLIEFWALQHERAKALRAVGVNTKLAADQSPVDLLWKSITARGERAEDTLTTMFAPADKPRPE